MKFDKIELNISNDPVEARENAITVAKELIKSDPIIIDTETTGLKGDDEIVEISVVDIKGNVLCDTLIKPIKPIPTEAERIHGISNEEVKNSPTFDQVWEEGLGELFATRPVCIYNSNFDLRMLRQTLGKYNLKLGKISSICVMKLYADFEGTWDSRFGNFKWHSLETAADHIKITVSNQLHRALTDAQVTRQVLLHIAKAEEGVA